MLLQQLDYLSKNEYADIEHGSSDWCEGGEQYKVLSNKRNNYSKK